MKTAVILAALLSGCSGMLTIPKEGRFTPNPLSEETKITWLVVDNPTEICKKFFPEAMHHHPVIPACAGWTEDRCVIVTGKVTNHQILGHEVRHCFEGFFHE